MTAHIRILFIGEAGTCGCYLKDVRNPEHVCGRPASWALVYGGVSLPICDRCAAQLAKAYEDLKKEHTNEAYAQD